MHSRLPLVLDDRLESAKSSRSIMLGTMSRVVAMPFKGRKDVISAAPSHTKLLLHQRWKLWLLGLMFTMTGAISCRRTI